MLENLEYRSYVALVINLLTGSIELSKKTPAELGFFVSIAD